MTISVVLQSLMMFFFFQRSKFQPKKKFRPYSAEPPPLGANCSQIGEAAIFDHDCVPVQSVLRVHWIELRYGPMRLWTRGSGPKWPQTRKTRLEAPKEFSLSGYAPRHPVESLLGDISFRGPPKLFHGDENGLTETGVRRKCCTSWATAFHYAI